MTRLVTRRSKYENLFHRKIQDKCSKNHKNVIICTYWYKTCIYSENSNAKSWSTTYLRSLQYKNVSCPVNTVRSQELHFPFNTNKFKLLCWPISATKETKSQCVRTYPIIKWFIQGDQKISMHLMITSSVHNTRFSCLTTWPDLTAWQPTVKARGTLDSH
jgi:hypothetical protein